MDWALKAGRIGTDQELKGQDTSLWFKFMKFLVYKTVKKRLGLNNSKFVIYGAAPLSLSTRQFFFDLNIFLNNLYGMSETAGPITGLMP